MTVSSCFYRLICIKNGTSSIEIPPNVTLSNASTSKLIAFRFQNETLDIHVQFHAFCGTLLQKCEFQGLENVFELKNLF